MRRGRGRIGFGKSGVEFGLVGIILGVVFIIAMVAAAPYIYTLFFSKSDIEKCRASVSVKSISIKYGTLGTRLFDPLDLNLDCHTKFLVAKKGGLHDTGSGKKLTDFSDRKLADTDLQYQLKTSVADRMAECWYMFGKGEVDPFSKFSGNVHCVQCYDIIFSDDEKEGVQKDAPALYDFPKFLAENYANEKETYAKYLYKANIPDLPRYDLDTSKEYSVVYYRSTKEFSDEVAQGVLGTSFVGGCFVGIKVGAVTGALFGPGGAVTGGFIGGGAGCLGGLLAGVVASSKTADIGKTFGIALIPIDSLGSTCRKLY